MQNWWEPLLTGATYLFVQVSRLALQLGDAKFGHPDMLIKCAGARRESTYERNSEDGGGRLKRLSPRRRFRAGGSAGAVRG
jgi:hypothetical protein